MHSIQEFFLGYPSEIRYAILALAIFLAGIGITPAPSDIVLAGIGVLVGHGIFHYGPAALICTVFILLGEVLLVETGHKMGPKLLASRLIVRTIGIERIAGLKKRLKRSQVRLMRSIRFTVPFRPYVIVVLSALGMNRKKFYKIHVINTLAYVPALIGGVGLISRSFDLKDWQLLVMIGLLWAISIFLPFQKGNPLDPMDEQGK